MKLLLISDLNKWSKRDINIVRSLSEYDVCFTLGNISAECLMKIQSVVKSPIYGINGDCDDYCVENAGIENIHRKKIQIGNVSFVGLQRVSRYKCEKTQVWTSEENIDEIEGTPKSDIFVTHDSAFRLVPNLPEIVNNDIKQYINIHQPKIHIHRHSHNSTIGTIQEWGCKPTRTVGIFRIVLLTIDGNMQIREFCSF